MMSGQTQKKLENSLENLVIYLKSIINFMTKLLNFYSFCSINEEESKTSNKEKVFALIADSLSRAYGIL
jgi:hypothetical protein